MESGIYDINDYDSNQDSMLCQYWFVLPTLIKPVFFRGGVLLVMSGFTECQTWQLVFLKRVLGIEMREGRVHASPWGVGGVNF